MTIAALAVVGLVAVHLLWRRRFQRLQGSCRDEIQKVRQQAQSAQEQAEARQRAVFDGMAEGLLLLDGTGRVQLANRRMVELFNLGREVRGRTLLEATRSHELAELVASVAQGVRVVNRILRLPGAGERYLEVNAAPILDASDNGTGVVLVLHDVTRLKDLERTREEFVANVSHELRTPLSLIKGYAETLLDSAGEDPELREKFLLTIDRNAQRLQFLIEDLLSISLLESGQVRLNVRPLSLREEGDRVIEDFHSTARARDITVVDELPDLAVEGDADRFHQVLGNLLDNAIKYGRRGGHVWLRARALPERMVQLCVADDGPGIPSDALPRIFERFYRVDKARSREAGGTGLGLSIVKHIVQSHGGRVWAESELGKGASFFFTLPQV